MSDDNLQIQIRAVEKEIAKSAADTKVKARSIYNLRNLLVIFLSLILLLILNLTKTSEADFEADANYIISQAHHDVMDYYHQFGVIPEQINNPALQPYVSIQKEGGNHFNLVYTLNGQVIVRRF